MRILITGGTGMVGTALQEVAPKATFMSSKEYDLRDLSLVEQMFARHSPDCVIHLAAKVGGVKANMEQMGAFYLDNIMINTNVLDAARNHNTKKVVSLLSTCVYPDHVVYPLTEDQIHNGPPHQSNFAYAYAKRMLDVQSRAYRKEYGCNFITAVPNNLFGEADNYDLENSHVIPAIIRKMYESKIAGNDVELWGDGSPLREFTYSLDVAKALLLLLDGYNDEGPINIGDTQEISIRSLAEKIAEKVGFAGDIIWQTSQPSGQYRKPSDNSKFRARFNLEYTDLDIALTNACDWFIMNYPNVRGVK